MTKRIFLFATCLALFLGAQSVAQTGDTLPTYVTDEFGHPPPVPGGALAPEPKAALAELVGHGLAQSGWDPKERSAFDVLANAADPRLAWTLVDLLRFSWRPDFSTALSNLALDLLGIAPTSGNRRAEITDHLIAWDIPAFDGYLDHKRAIYTRYLPGLEPILQPGAIDWHLVTPGGVNIDDRPFGSDDTACGCIPAADDPPVTLAAKANWLANEAIVFGVTIGAEARAYPLRIMEVREMVNDELGGRRIALPYCSLCGAAQAYFTDNAPLGADPLVMRTSGLLIRSNKVMYDLTTHSVFDTFRGRAVTGPLAEIGFEFQPVTVVTTTWGDWKRAHPETTVLVESLALGREYNLRATRDHRGPIFPIGNVDPRLGVQDDVLGVLAPSGEPLAFDRNAALAALRAGAHVTQDGVQLELAAGGLRALDENGKDLASHQAYWFAWSQFYPDTAIWPLDR